MGSALAKAVREGYLVVVGEGTRRGGKTYEFTPKSAPLFASSPPPPRPGQADAGARG